MKLLLDTVAFPDAVLRPQDLPVRARELLLDADNERYLSIASSWEIVIKYSLGKLALPADPQFFVPEHRNRLAAEALHIDEESVLQIPRPPPVHRDPFDRILVSQALVHGMVLVTPDTRIAKYPVRIAW